MTAGCGDALLAGDDGAVRPNPGVAVLALDDGAMAADGSVAFVPLGDGAMAAGRRVSFFSLDGHAVRTGSRRFSIAAVHHRRSACAPHLPDDLDPARDDRGRGDETRERRTRHSSHGCSVHFLSVPAVGTGASFMFWSTL